MNLRPSGYEPDELPDCSTPRYEINGWRWIRTTEAICSRFTVCPLWPLGNPSIFFLFDGTNRARTYDPLLVRQMLSQLSYDPIQTTQKRLELSTSAVTGRRSNKLSHWAIFCCTYVPSKLHTRNISFSSYLSPCLVMPSTD